MRGGRERRKRDKQTDLLDSNKSVADDLENNLEETGTSLF